MKQIKCEMCGSTDLVKQEGVFVCQSCGIKYSIDEVKKMMIEGTVDVQGTVKVDTTDRLKNLYTLARRAKEDDNAPDAARYYNEIKLEVPNDWEAAFYSLYYSAMDITIAQIASAARSILKSLDSVMELIVRFVPEEEQKNAYTEVANRILLYGNMLLNASKSAYSDSLRRFGYDAPSSVDNDYEERKEAIVVTMATTALSIESYFNDSYVAQQTVERAIDICESSGVDYYLIHTLKEYKEKYDNQIQSLKDKKKEEYWLAHKDEKNELDRRFNQVQETLKPLIEQRDSLNRQKNNLNNRKNDKVSAEKELQVVISKIDSLKREFSSLGIFSGRRKKEIQAELESLSVDKSRVEKLVTEQRSQLQREIGEEIKRIDEQLSPIKTRIESLKASEKAIIDELDKDR